MQKGRQGWDVWATVEESWKWSVMRRWCWWSVERRGENIIREGLDELRESQHTHPHICLSIPWGHCNSRRNRTCVLSHLSPPHRNICLLTQAICLVTQALSCLHPPISLSCLFPLSVPILLSLMVCQELADTPAAWLHGHSVSIRNCPLQTNPCLNKHILDAHCREIDLLSWNSKAEFASSWHYKVQVCIKINDSSISANITWHWSLCCRPAFHNKSQQH